MLHTPSATLAIVSYKLTDEFLKPWTRLVLIPHALMLLWKNLNLFLLDCLLFLSPYSLTRYFCFTMLSSSFFFCSWFSIKITSMLLTIFWAVRSHKWYPFTLLVYSKKIHLLNFRFNFIISWPFYITYTGYLNAYKWV